MGTQPSAIRPQPGRESRRIREVVEETGVSKELIHHYLRLGLLPRSEERAVYDDRQVRLLRQIRTLREDHNLPLEIIRRLFTLLGFEPAHVESLTLSESLGKRVTEFTGHGDGPVATLSRDQLAGETGIDGERLAAYLRARLIEPLAGDGEARFVGPDAKVVALCERGVELGIPFDAFRTVASYVRMAFELEHRVFFGLPDAAWRDADRLLAELFVRREVTNGFVHALLTALTHRKMRQLLDQPGMNQVRLDDVVYRPSPLFVRRHDLDHHVDQARERVRDRPDDPVRRVDAGRVMTHAGRYQEAAFFLGESLDRWPDHAGLRASFGRASLLVGDVERARTELAAVRGAGPAALLALAHFGQAQADHQPELLIRHAVPVLGHVEAALAPAAGGSHQPDALEAALLAGWLLTALPPVFAEQTAARGLQVLADAVDRIERRRPEPTDLPGQRERLLINGAHLLLDAVRRAPAPPAALVARAPALRASICRLDPASGFAEAAFLGDADQPRRPRSSP